MNFVILIVGIVVERYALGWMNLKEFRLLDGYGDWAANKLNQFPGIVGFLIALAVVLVPVLPVIALVYLLQDAWNGWAQYLFSIVVLVVSLGPRDLVEATDELADANDKGDLETAKRVSKEITEVTPPEASTLRCRAIAEAIFVQANNKLFGVIFWFLLLGPIGSWLFHVSDLIRRRVMYESLRDESSLELKNSLTAVFRVHGMLAWVPARLLALGYAMAGSFEDAVSDWRGYYQNTAEHFFEVSEDVVAAAGCGALGRAMNTLESDQEQVCRVEADTVRSAMSLVHRTLWIWLTAIAVLTIVAFEG
ncbi:MAG: regulatory signaling modulator protein AmpE [Pseudomonadota bacterium]